ncbi:MAG: hypothetical protein V9E87_00305 [Gemmatimonadales bacterium]
MTGLPASAASKPRDFLAARLQRVGDPFQHRGAGVRGHRRGGGRRLHRRVEGRLDLLA